MGYTITEKILARVAGRDHVRAGDEVMAKPDFVVVYDFPGYTDVIFKQMKEDFGIERLAEPERYAIFIDHMVPTATAKEEELHIQTRDWCREHDVALYERRGIGHQVSAEVGYASPGAFVVHFDGHISQLGAYGTLAIGLRRNILEAFVRERVSLKVPQTTRINLSGRLSPGVMARDVFHHIVRVLGPSGCRAQVMEIGGPGLANLSLEGRQTICGLAMFAGAITAIVNPDALSLAYTDPRAKYRGPIETSDPDAVYSAVHDIDFDALEPIVVLPPNPSNTRNLSEHLGLAIDAGYLGSCASGRLEDLRIAAQILKGRRVKDGFALHVIPTSQEIMARAAAEGLITDLVEAGAFTSSPSCDYCFGRIAVMSPGQRAVSTGTLNVPGRMGSPDFESISAMPPWSPLRRSRAASPIPASICEDTPMSLANLRGRVAWIFEEENFDVDQIVGVKNIKITDVAELAALAMTSFDPDFAAKIKPGDLIVGAGNFGDGHPHYPPLRAMRHLGLTGVVAELFSPGFWRGEISMGTPLVGCPGIVAAVQRWDEIEVDWNANLVRNLTRGVSLAVEPLARADRLMLEAGGLVPYLKSEILV